MMLRSICDVDAYSSRGIPAFARHDFGALGTQWITYCFLRVHDISMPAWFCLDCSMHSFLQVIAIDVDDPLAKDLNDIADVESLLPGYVSGIREWFRWYKTPDDKPLNGFGFDEKALDQVCFANSARK